MIKRRSFLASLAAVAVMPWKAIARVVKPISITVPATWHHTRIIPYAGVTGVAGEPIGIGQMVFFDVSTNTYKLFGDTPKGIAFETADTDQIVRVVTSFEVRPGPVSMPARIIHESSTDVDAFGSGPARNDAAIFGAAVNG